MQGEYKYLSTAITYDSFILATFFPPHSSHTHSHTHAHTHTHTPTHPIVSKHIQRAMPLCPDVVTQCIVFRLL